MQYVTDEDVDMVEAVPNPGKATVSDETMASNSSATYTGSVNGSVRNNSAAVATGTPGSAGKIGITTTTGGAGGGAGTVSSTIAAPPPPPPPSKPTLSMLSKGRLEDKYMLEAFVFEGGQGKVYQ